MLLFSVTQHCNLWSFNTYCKEMFIFKFLIIKNISIISIYQYINLELQIALMLEKSLPYGYVSSPVEDKG